MEWNASKFDMTGTYAKSVAIDSAGRIFVAGNDVLNYRGLVRKSTNGGSSWSSSIDVNDGRETHVTYFRGVIAAPDDTLYAYGSADQTQPGTTECDFGLGGCWPLEIYKSTDHGTTWTDVGGKFTLPYAKHTLPRAMAADSSGNVYVVGFVNYIPGSPNWVQQVAFARKSADSGATWSTVDTRFQSDYGASQYTAVCIAPSGKVFLGGWSSSAGWLVRRSSDSGSTWDTVDDFRLSVVGQNYVVDILCSSAGDVYALGNALGTNGVLHHVVRKSSDGGTTWTTVDDLSGYQSKYIDPTEFAVYYDLYNSDRLNGYYPTDIVEGPGGGIYVTGHALLKAVIPGIDLPWSSFIRKSANGGSTWSEIALYDGPSAMSKNRPPHGFNSLAFDGSGNMYLAGRYSTLLDGNGQYDQFFTYYYQWDVLKSSDSGSNWSVLDRFTTP